MITEWTQRGFMIVAGGIRNNANLEAQTIQAVNETAIDQANTFSVPLSPTGNEPATHYGCNSALKSGMADAWANSFFNGHPIPSSRYFIIDAFTGILLDTNTNQVTGVRWAWQDTLSNANLQVIEPETP